MQQLSQQRAAVEEKNLFALFSGPENVCRRSRHPRPHTHPLIVQNMVLYAYKQRAHIKGLTIYVKTYLCVRCRMKVNFGLCDRFFAAIYYYVPVNFIVYIGIIFHRFMTHKSMCRVLAIGK